MGQSVLTPEEDLLGKVGEPAGRQKFSRNTSLGNGGKGIRLKFRNRLVGNAQGQT